MVKVTVPRGPYKTGIRRRREIVAAASRIFARYGYGGGSLRQIADDVGVTPAALARHFDNKYGLLQAVLVYWEEETFNYFDGAHGLEYFRRLPGLVEHHADEPGLIELLLTLATEATDPGHPARDWAVERYARVVNLGIGYLREAREAGEIGPMDDHQIEVEARAVFALMDGLQLQWLLDPSLPVAEMFRAQLDTIIERWSRNAKRRRRRPRPLVEAVKGSSGGHGHAPADGEPDPRAAMVTAEGTGASAGPA